jgi:hypothetical protein
MVVRISAALRTRYTKPGGYMANDIVAQTATCLVCQHLFELLDGNLEVTKLPHGNRTDTLVLFEAATR